MVITLEIDSQDFVPTYLLICVNVFTCYQNLSSTQNHLQESYDGLNESCNAFQSIHNTLTFNYVQLQGNYTQLASSYNDLQTDQSNLSTDLTNYRNLALCSHNNYSSLSCHNNLFCKKKAQRDQIAG